MTQWVAKVRVEYDGKRLVYYLTEFCSTVNPDELTGDKMTTQAQYAIKAVTIRKQCGRYAASQYARKHGVSSLYRLALQLEAIGE